MKRVTPFFIFLTTPMASVRTSLIKYFFHPFFQLVLGGALLFVFVFPTDVWAGNLIEKAIELVNRDRVQSGLSPLVENSLLTAAAEAKADDMMKHDYFAHTSPLGQSPWYWLKQTGYQYKAAGENLAINYDDATEQHRAWMKSATHRANILNGHFQEIGMATRHGRINGQEATITVQLFGTPRTPIVSRQPESTSSPASSPAVQGEEITAPLREVVPSQAVVTIPPNVTTVLVTKTVWENILSLSFIRDQVWLKWAEIGVTAVLLLLSLLTPLLFLAKAVNQLRATLQPREAMGYHIPVHQGSLGSSRQ
ncbi:MAG: CAP domain-containing protein [Candidatus Moraniibacteriota bacterium]|nr:MAG: CAP domain-containing protein [Candidatus Moranbacteria bacterium]